MWWSRSLRRQPEEVSCLFESLSCDRHAVGVASDGSRRTAYNISNAVLIKVIMHTAFAFERVIRQNPIAFPEEEEMNDQLENVLHITEKTLKPYEEKLGLAISEDEKMFIASIFAEEL